MAVVSGVETLMSGTGHILISGLVSPSADYVTPTEEVDLSAYLKKIKAFIPQGVPRQAGEYLIGVDYTNSDYDNSSVILYIHDATDTANTKLAELADNTNCQAVALTFEFLAMGEQALS